MFALSYVEETFFTQSPRATVIYAAVQYSLEGANFFYEMGEALKL